LTEKEAAELKPESPGDRTFAQLRLACYLTVAVVVARLLYTSILHPLKIGWDPALHLHAAILITQGRVPYVDMFDVNPPLIWYLDTIPAFAAKWFALHPTQAFGFFLTFLIGLSAFLCTYLLFKRGNKQEAIFFLPFVIGICAFNFFLRFDFGQREDIFVLLYMPFFVLRWLTWSGRGQFGRGLKIAVGIIGGLGVCLKPYFLIPAALTELYYVLDQRRLKPLITTETIACALVGFAYMGHFFLAPQAMRENYLGFIVPAFQLGYNFWDCSLAAMFSPPDKRNVFFLMTGAILLSLAMRRRSGLFLPLAIFCLTSNIAYLIQFKGWTYHNQPVFASALMLAYMLAGYLICLAFRELKKMFSLSSSLFIFCVPVIFLGYGIYDAAVDTIDTFQSEKFDLDRIGYSGFCPLKDVESSFLDVVLDNTRPGDSVVFMSNGVQPEYPFVTQLGLKPGSRHLHCVILSVLQYIKDERPDTPFNRALYDHTPEIIRQYGEDIENNKPELVLIQNSPVGDYLEPFQFVSKYLKDYKQIDEIDSFRVFRLDPLKKLQGFDAGNSQNVTGQ